MTKLLWFSLLSAGFLALLCRADTVYLTTGDEVSGTVIEDTPNTVLIRQPNGVMRSIRKKDVDTIVYERAPRLGDAKAAAGPLNPAETPAGRGAKMTGEAAASKTEDKKPAAAAAPKDDKQAKGAPDAPKDAKDAKDTKDTAAADKAGAPKDTDEAGAKKKEDQAETREPLKLAGFPEKAKRMDTAKEKIFLDALEQLTSDKEEVRGKAKDNIAALGAGAVPYLVAGIQHASVYARTACMNLLSQLNGRNAIKAVIEVFYAAMPEKGEAATYQVPFIQAIKDTLPVLTGQSFITVEARASLVQEGLQKYVDWYKTNYDRLPRQAGEPEFDPTDPDLGKKLKEARELKLTKKEWPRPPMPAELTAGSNKSGPAPAPYPPSLPVTGGVPGERKVDQQFKESIPTVPRGDALKREQDKRGY